MKTRYITTKVAQFYTAASGGTHTPLLIFGDAVEVTGPAVGARLPVVFRGRQGFVEADQLGDHPPLELYFIDVGQGDATFIVTPGRKTFLIDGGMNRRALGFLAWKYRLDKPGPPIDLDLLVLSHADSDHLDGLEPIVSHPRIRVHQVIHSGVAVFAPGACATSLGDLDQDHAYLVTHHTSLHELEGLRLSPHFSAWRDTLIAEGCAYSAVDSMTGLLDIGDPTVKLEVLGPRLDQLHGQPALRWFGNSSHTINGHSVVLRLSYGDVSVLLPGDLNHDGAEHLMADPYIRARLDAHVLKAPHHGSHEFYPPLLAAIQPQISVISSGDDVDHGHPRSIFVGAVGHYSRSEAPLVFSTEIAANFVEATESLERGAAVALKHDNPPSSEINAQARLLFKQRLHGMINVRTDGQELYAARRVAAPYRWEAYGPLAAAPAVT